ncbi:MAG: GAF domain-containing protein [Desulfobacula sp.]|nr:GAF domain-containing protein [Desulfobacula sp.]
MTNKNLQVCMGNDQLKKIEKKRDPGKTIEVLFKISDAVSKTRNLNELYKVIHESLDEILNVDNFYIALHHKENDSITFPYHVDAVDENAEEIFNFSRQPSITGKVIYNRKPMIFYEQDIKDLASEFGEKVIGTVSKIWLGAPLIVNNKTKGAIVIQSYTSATAYQKEDLDLLNSVSQHIALAIERKESREAMHEQDKILRKILESSPVGIALVRNRIFKWVNNEMVRMFGYESKKDFENQSTRMVYADDVDFDMTGDTIYTSLITTATADYEIELVKKDMSLFPGHIRLSCDDINHPLEWTIATFTDISQRKIGEKEKFEKERLQGVLEMAGAICHEINQPLQAILGYSELLLMDEKLGAGEDNIHSIKSQASRLGRITRKLSNITHYRTVNYPGNTKIVDIWGAGSDIEH